MSRLFGQASRSDLVHPMFMLDVLPVERKPTQQDDHHYSEITQLRYKNCVVSYYFIIFAASG